MHMLKVGGGGGGGGGGAKTGERTHMERTCSGKLFPHFVLSNRTPTRVIFTEMQGRV